MSVRAKLDIRLGDFSLCVDLGLPARGITSIHGPSGSGKTTLLRAIAGLDRHPGGLVEVAGVTWQDELTFLPVHRRSLGYVFQESSLFAHMNVRGNIHYGIRRAGPGRRAPCATQLIELLGLGSMLDRYPGSLSGGERRRVAIARALAPWPSLLLLDEPMAGLDAKRRAELMPFLEQLHASLDIPVLHVSHSGSEVLRLADQLVLLEEGRVAAQGPLEALLTRLDLPFAHRDDAAVVMHTRVLEIDDRYGLANLEFSGQVLAIVDDGYTPGQSLRVSIAARDVSIGLDEPRNSSILNVFPATVAEVCEETAALVMVRLSIASVTLLARITRKSAQALVLKKGDRVFAQVKSVALLN